MSRRGFLQAQSAALGGIRAWPEAVAAAIAVKYRIHDRSTTWHLEPSLGFDTLCFLNTLTGDPYYLTYYQPEYEYFAPSLDATTRAALAWIQQQIADERGDVMSAFLCRQLSAGGTRSIDDLLATVDAPGAVEAALETTALYNSDDWQLFLKLRPQLRIVLQGVQRLGFEEYWDTNVAPIVAQRIRALGRRLDSYDVVAEDERILGATFPSRQITACLVTFNKPAAIRVAGQRFIACATWEPRVIVHTAVHEMLHPPYDLARDAELRSAVDSLNGDAFVMEKVTGHNRSIGYNTLDGLFEEDAVRALDQLVMERLRLADAPRKRWKDEDDGLHVLAAVLYGTMKEAGYPAPGQRFRDFLLAAFRTGTIGPGRIKPLYDRFMK